jgi:Ni,Fe-hydrogenase III large subunit
MSSSTIGFAPLSVDRAVPLDLVPLLAMGDFARILREGMGADLRVAALFGSSVDEESGARGGGETGEGRGGEEGAGRLQLYAILADDRSNALFVGRAEVEGGSFPSLAREFPQVQLFEREIAEQFGAIPLDHPWLKPVRYQSSWTGRDAWNRNPLEPILPAVGDFYRVEGEDIHEVAVGPVHAGVIEPGHFRFQCHGEEVFHLEIALGFQHRGVERALSGGPSKRSLHYAETLAGDSTVAHASAYCQNLETLGSCRMSPRSEALRGVALELERLANHVGDLGAIAGDTGYLPTSSFCGRIRGDFLNMTALLCGNRFGRGMVLPGGVGFDLDESRGEELLRRLAVAEKETTVAVNLLWESPSVMARLEDTGPLPREVAVQLGVVGPAARASGLARDLRCDQPSGIYRFAQIPVSTYDSGDVFARAYLRWLEIQQSLVFIREQVENLPAGNIEAPVGELAARSLAVALDEGWRGEVCHVGITDDRGRFARYKVVDPSFHNWPALAYALRGQDISDFPLCNKSFNLSYCGHDL